MGRTPTMRIQDTIHGLMEFHGMETAVVEVLRAKELQRLRRIRQLGLAHLVFPGAEHSRLVHSIGAAHLAIRFASRLREATRDILIPFLQPGPTEIRDLAVAALCHDLGHGPLSHLWEREVVEGDAEKFDRQAWASALGLGDDIDLRKLKWHEMVGQALLAWPEGELHQLLEQHETGSSTRIRRLLAGEHYLPYLPRLLSSDIDVDRCDFILRDAFQTGVAYGRYDLNWLISSATVAETAEGSLVIGFDAQKAARVVEQFLVARRALYDTVYYHKTVRCAEAMVGLFLRRLKDFVREKGWPQSLGESALFDSLRKVMEGQTLDVEAVLSLDDNAIWVLLQLFATGSNIDPTAASLAKRIVGRDLFKIVPCQEDKLEKFLRRRDYHHRLLDCVKSDFGEGEEYFVHVDHSSFSMFGGDPKDNAYFVSKVKGERRATPIQDHPQLLAQRQHARETQTRILVPREAVDVVRKMINDG